MKIFALLSIVFFALPLFGQVSIMRISKASSTDPNEITLAINPVNPQHLIACANMNYRYYSNDSGKTWSEGYTNSSGTDHGDPVLTFDSRGNAYRAHLNSTQTAINVQVSKDGGINWTPKGGNIGSSGFDIEDKPWVICDTRSKKYKDNLYLAWTEFSGGGFGPTYSKIRFARSADSGATWSKPIDIIPYDTVKSSDKDDDMFGTSFAIGDSGEIFLLWAGKYGIQFVKSFDGGKTMSKAASIATMPNGGLDLSIPGMTRYYSFPALAYDHSNTPTHGRLYATWADQRNGSSNTDIFLISSDDSGATWTTAKKVNTDNSKHHQFMPAISVDSMTGLVYIFYYDRRNYPDTRTELYLSRSTDGGASFKDMKLSKRPFALPATATNSDFIGDYNGISAIGGYVYAMWTEDSATNRSVWLAKWRDTVITNVVNTGIAQRYSEEPFTVLQNYPNPCPGYTEIAYALPDKMQTAELYIKNELGNEVYHGVSRSAIGTFHLNTIHWHPGIYFYYLKAGPAISSIKEMVIIK